MHIINHNDENRLLSAILDSKIRWTLAELGMIPKSEFKSSYSDFKPGLMHESGPPGPNIQLTTFLLFTGLRVISGLEQRWLILSSQQNAK
jgi:hypothetical protein